MEDSHRNPLTTLEYVVGAIFLLMLVVASAVLVGAVAGQGSIPGVDAEVCVTTDPGRHVGFREDAGGAATGPVDLAEGVRWHTSAIELCDPSPDGTTRALGVLGLTGWAFAPLIFFGLLWRMLRRARHEGVFADRAPSQLRLLGVFLLGWAALDFVLTGLVNGALITRMTQGDPVFFSGDLPWLLILLGLALLALERVMAQAVMLRAESEATI